jgi:class 3 adenylate cyclase/tetratricopeptide (TPR) repeat protein
MAACPRCGRESDRAFRYCPHCGAPLAAPARSRELRKTVTVLFCDVTGSTALGESVDPEVLRALLARYYERMRGIVERHGGTVEKFVGDAVMAVFGVPVVHEDDALRACRAAVEMRAAFTELGITGRIGVNTGEVVAGTQEWLATGDAVNVAARLEQAASPGEVLVGEPTLALVRAAVDAEQVEPLALRGKREPVPAYRLLAVRSGLGRRFATPMVGRERELQGLRDAFARTVHDRSCQLFTVLGVAGVGKSRLAAEFLLGLEARAVRGGCLPYGEGITYWPVIEILKQLGTLSDADVPGPLRSLLGESDEDASADGIAWGFRKLLEQEAKERPLVVVLDDLQWAEPTLLDLVEHAADLSQDAPILLLCMARPELLELRPSWGGGKWNAASVLLEPLDADESERLLEALGGTEPKLQARIAAAAEGNPLFLEEMLALVLDSPGERVEVPPTIQALLAARLDQLDEDERGVLERGSVEGRVFHEGAVMALADGEPPRRAIVSLVRKQLLRPDTSQLPHEEAYRFRHLLVRDAAYDGLRKAVRADLHERFADWLEERAGDRLAEYEEIVGYHLEQAQRYRGELGEAEAELAERAGARLAAAGRRALWRGDDRAAANLLERALTLTRPHALDVMLELDLSQALWTDPARAMAVAEAAAERAFATADETGAALARAVATQHGVQCSARSLDDLEADVQTARPLVEASGDHAALATVLWLVGPAVANIRGRYDEWASAAELGLEHTRLAGQRQPGDRFRIATALAIGPRPAEEALRTLDSLLPDTREPWACLRRAELLAMLERSSEAWLVAQQARELFRAQGAEWGEYALATVAALAGEGETACGHWRNVCDWLEATRQNGFLASHASLLGLELCRLGRYDEAEARARQSRELGDRDYVVAQGLWRQVQALVESQRDNHADAERLVREALAYLERTDSLAFHGGALRDLAEVLLAAGRTEEAAAAFAQALDRYERKQVLPLARRVRERLATLEPVGR